MNQYQGIRLEQIEQGILRVHEWMDQNPGMAGSIFVFLAIWVAWKRLGRRERRMVGNMSDSRAATCLAGGLLSQVLFMWSPHDPLLIRDMLRSIAIFGASGSGKTSGSGFQIAKAAVGMGRKISVIIFASKPEDREFWLRIFAEQGRKRDLLVFGPDSPLRFNFLDFVQRSGGDTRDITQAIMVIGETLEQGSGVVRQHDPFWRQQNERMIFNAVEVVLRATGRVTAPDLQRFISGAAKNPAVLSTPEWQAGFHDQCLQAAFGKLHTSIERHDYHLAADYWLNEFPGMAEKTRSSILAGVMGFLHVFNTGIVRELISTSTNVSPAALDEGLSILVDMPISRDGAAGTFVLGVWKYATQWYILKRHVTENTPICVLWSDEYQKVANSFDPPFLAECRSHRGCMVILSQSIHSLYARIREGGEHETDSLLTNFYHKIFHAVGDDKTAAFASSLVGRRLTTHMGGSSSSADNAYDELFGHHNRFSSSFSQQIENALENREFMQGLRTGGKENGYIVDGLVVRSGEPFSNGEAFLKVAFDQRG